MHIAILSRGPQLYSTQSLFRAAQRHGHRVRVMDHTKFDIVIENGMPKLLYLGEDIPHIDAIIPRIGSSVSYYGCSVVRQFQQMNIFSTVSADAIQRSRDKLHCLQILSNSGLGIPKTIFSKDMQDAHYIIDNMGAPPLIIKLLEGTHGAGVILAQSYTAAVSIIEALASTNQRFLVQEFIAESKGADIRALVVDGEVVASMKRKARPGDFRSNLHRGGSSIHIKLTGAEEETALKATKLLGLKVAGVDMLESDRGPLILEVNPSPGLEGIERTTGVDIAGKIIEYVNRNLEPL